MKDPKDMTARELLEQALTNYLANGEDIETFILAAKTKKSHGLACYGRREEIAALLTVSALEQKSLRPTIHMASDGIKLFERKYDAEASDKSTDITLTKEQLEQLLKKGGKA